MTVQDLIEILQALPPGAEVRLAQQPSWPLQMTIAGLAYQSADDGEIYPVDDAPEPESPDQEQGQGIVFIVEGNHPGDTPYAPRGCWDVL